MATPVSKPAFNPDEFIFDSKGAPLTGDICIQGPPASGKTQLFTTISEHFPVEIGKEWVTLSDVGAAAFDLGAFDGLKVNKILVPFIDARALIDKFGVMDGIKHLFEMLPGFLDKYPNIKYFGFDTISAVDKLWHEYLDKGADDGRSMYRHMLNNHVRFHQRMHAILRPRGIIPIATFHSKAKVLMPDATEAQKKTQTADKLPGGNDIQIDVTGQAHGLWIKDSSLVIVMQCKMVKGKPPVYTALPYGGSSFEGKNRFARIFDDEEEPNLRKMLNKIKAASAA